MHDLNRALFIVVFKQINRKIPYPCNAKEHYQSFLKKKNRKSVQKSEIITYQPKTFKNSNIIGIKTSYYRTYKNFTYIIQGYKKT